MVTLRARTSQAIRPIDRILRALARAPKTLSARLPATCRQCHAPLPAGRRGKRGAKPRYCNRRCRDAFDFVRRRARLGHVCACGARTRARECRVCRARRAAAARACHCGKPKSIESEQCVGCALATCRRRSATCRYCGVVFTPKGYGRTKYCSREHCFAYWHEHGRNRKPRALVVKVTRPCRRCGTLTTRSRYCSDVCALVPVKSFVCLGCGETVTRERLVGTQDRRSKYCSRACARAVSSPSVKRLIDEWPTGSTPPAELLHARRLVGLAILFLSNRSKFEERHDPSVFGVGAPSESVPVSHLGAGDIA